VHLPTFLIPGGSGSVIFGDLRFQNIKSLTYMYEAVVEHSFISGIGEIGQRTVRLTRRDSVRLYESAFSTVFLGS